MTSFTLGLALKAKPEDVIWDTERRTAPITVIAANFNNARYLTSFFYSLSKSTLYPSEVIVVDDGSSDDSKALLNLYSERIPCLKTVFFDRNRGFANALNTAIDLASMPYLMRMDPDDIFHPSRIEIQWRAINSSHAHFIGSNALIFNDFDGRPITETNFPIGPPNIRARYLKGEHGFLHPTTFGLKTAFCELMYVQENVPAEDYDIFARAIKRGYILENCSESLIFYRAHAGSASTRLKFSLIEMTFRLRDEIFGSNTPRVSVLRYYIYIYSYRRHLYNSNVAARYVWGSIAAIFAPIRLLKRILR